MFEEANVSSVRWRQLVCNQGLINISVSPLRSHELHDEEATQVDEELREDESSWKCRGAA